MSEFKPDEEEKKIIPVTLPIMTISNLVQQEGIHYRVAVQGIYVMDNAVQSAGKTHVWLLREKHRVRLTIWPECEKVFVAVPDETAVTIYNLLPAYSLMHIFVPPCSINAFLHERH